MTATAEQQPWTHARLVDWFKPNGRAVVEFCGAVCSKRKRTANVPEMAGWWCVCGSWNMLGLPGWNQWMHEHPDQGPPRDMVIAAMKENGL